LFSIAVPEAAGGAGGTVADLAAALEELTLALVPGQVLPALASVRKLLGVSPTGRRWPRPR
jgi:alkylation response protein AidB-like acyl-CoA dehydrogenase